MTDAQRKLDLIRSRRSGPTTTTVVLTEPGRFIHSRFGSRQPLAGRLMWHVRCPACRVIGHVHDNDQTFTCKMTTCKHRSTVVREGAAAR